MESTNKLAYSEDCEVAIRDNIIIDSPDEMIERLYSLSGRNDFTLDDVVSFVNETDSTIFFVDNKLRMVDEGSSDISYVYIDTGLVDTLNKPIFLSLLPTGSIFAGHYVGNIKFLSSLMVKYYSKNRKAIEKNVNTFLNDYHVLASKRIVRSLEFKKEDDSQKVIKLPTIKDEPSKPVALNKINTLEISKDVFNMLLVNNWNSLEGLDRYIKIIGTRITQLIGANKTDYFIMNNIKSVVVNTGLLDRFCSDIKVLYRYNISYQSYIPYKIMESKKEYGIEGFTKEQSCKKILPITFLTATDVFNPQIDDFDINPRNLNHIIEERRSRFPDNCKDTSEAILATRIKTELDLGLKLNSIDNGYAKPYYSGSTGTVSWLLPLRIERELSEEPELVLVIHKVDEFWEIKTILPYDNEIKDRLICTSLYSHLW